MSDDLRELRNRVAKLEKFKSDKECSGCVGMFLCMVLLPLAAWWIVPSATDVIDDWWDEHVHDRFDRIEQSIQLRQEPIDAP